MKPLCNSILSKYKFLPAAAVLALLSVRAVNAADYPTTVLADNPLVYYRLEETSGATAFDSSASGDFPGDYNFINSYPILGQPGIDTNSISVSGAQTASVSAGYYPELNQQAPFSFEIWARPVSTSTTDYRCPIGNFSGWNTPTQSGWYVYQTPGGSASRFNLVLQPADIEISQVMTPLSWYHLVGTYDGTNVSFYINGALVGTANAAGYVANEIHNSGIGSLALGDRGDQNCFFDGGLDEFAYYTNALTAAQVLTHYQAGTNSFRVAALPPSILTDVISTNVYAGHIANFHVIADGTAPLVYQWYKGSAPITDATNNTYNFATVPTDDGTTYSVIVTNFVGSATSSVATLSVSTGLQVNGPLTSIVRNAGSAAAFEIAADGALPITYQWHNGDGSLIAGATNNVLWLSSVALADDGSTYYVSIINPYTSIDSDAATLNVQARAVNVSTNGYAKVVIADGPVAYWRLDETNGSTIATDAVGSFDGTYQTNLAGTFTFGAPTGIPHETNAALGLAAGTVDTIPQGETVGATVNIPYAIEINPVGAFTVDGWFEAASTTTGGNDYRTVISSMSNPYGIGPTGWLVYQTSANNWSWWPYNGYYGSVQLTDLDPVVPNQWYHLALVYDGTTFTFYVNGVAKASGTDSAFVQNGNVPIGGSANYNYNYNQGVGLPLGSGSMVLGQRVDDAFNPFVGTIDDVAVYNKALTPQQIQNHFLNTTHLTITSSSSQFVVSWSTGTLQSSTNVSGPYLDVIGATSPYTNSMAGTRFYRAQLQ